MKCAYCHKKIKSGDYLKLGKLAFCNSTCRDSYKEADQSDKVTFNHNSATVEAKIRAPEFKDHELAVKFHFWSGPRLYLDGEAQKPIKRKVLSLVRLYEIKDADDQDIEVKISTKVFDPTPVVKINGRFYPITYNLRWFEYIWLGLPLLLFLLGGILGVVLGSITMLVNSRFFQSRRKILEKYSFTGLIMAICFFTYYQSASLIHNSYRQSYVRDMQLFKEKLHGQDPFVYYLTKHPWVVSNVIDKKGKVMKDRLAEFKGDVKTFNPNGDFTQLHRDGSELTGTWHYVAKGHRILLDAGREVRVLFITRISNDELNLESSGITVEHRKGN